MTDSTIANSEQPPQPARFTELKQPAQLAAQPAQSATPALSSTTPAPPSLTPSQPSPAPSPQTPLSPQPLQPAAPSLLSTSSTALPPSLSVPQSPLTIITGHYGVGKTNLALNLVARWRSQYPNITLIDLDVVNPYFRSSDSAEWLANQSVSLLGPSLARSTLDTPSLAPGIDDAIRRANTQHPVVIDVGGDPDGARALARYAPSITRQNYALIYVANFNRPEVADVDSSLLLMQAIETQSGLKATALIGNSHLKEHTSVEQIMSTLPALLELSQRSGLPIFAITAPEALADGLQAAMGENYSIRTVHKASGVDGSNEDEVRSIPDNREWVSSIFDSEKATKIPVLPMIQMVKTPWE